ncbi:MAG: Gx transporter family protein [bacterium]
MRLLDRSVRMAVYSALALGLYTVENYLPTPLPWLRFGIGNIAVVLALDELGVTGAVVVFLVKLILGSIIGGRFLTPFFFFGAAGGVLSLAVMILLWVLGRGFFSVVGVSCAGGVFHNIGQLLAARFFLIPSQALWRFLPIIVLVGLGTGSVNGIFARLIQLRLREYA